MKELSLESCHLAKSLNVYVLIAFETVSYCLAGQFAVISIDSGVDHVIVLASLLQTLVCDLQSIAECSIGNAIVDVLGTAPGIFPTQ